MDKRIISWSITDSKKAEGERPDFSRAFIFDNYGDTYDHYSRMVAEAKKDFPDLKDSDITISKVSKSSYMQGFAVISFLVESGLERPDYQSTTRFDFSY